jgi:hypothetical protein
MTAYVTIEKAFGSLADCAGGFATFAVFEASLGLQDAPRRVQS